MTAEAVGPPASPAASRSAAPLGLIAGAGVLPRLVAEAATRAGRRVQVIGLAGFAEPWIADYPHVRVGLAQVGRLLGALERAGCAEVCLAGGLARPALLGLVPDLTGLRLAPRFVRLFRKGDDGLLRGVAQVFEERGFEVIGASALLGDLLAPEGALTRRRPSAADLADIARAAEIVAALGRVDVGQGAVVARGRCLAVETVQGTDAMLERLDGDRRRGGAPIPSGVLYKAPKPGQDLRLDLPAIGPATVERARRAGLDGVAVAAGAVFVLEPQAVVEAADAAGLFVYGAPA